MTTHASPSRTAASEDQIDRVVPSAALPGMTVLLLHERGGRLPLRTVHTTPHIREDRHGEGHEYKGLQADLHVS
jgi:hypothetical protein